MKVSEWIKRHPHSLGTIPPGWSADAIIDHILSTPGLRDIYVAADDGRLLGHITYYKVARMVLAEHQPEHNRRQLMEHAASCIASELMNCHFVTAELDEELEDILHRLLEHKVEDMPVIDANGKPVGAINLGQILKHFRENTLKDGQ